MSSIATLFPSGGIHGTNVGKTLKRRRCYCEVDMVNFQPKSTGQDEKIRTGQKNRRQGQFQHCRLDYFPGGIEHVRGDKTDDRQTLEPSAVLGQSPRLFDWRYFVIQAE